MKAAGTICILLGAVTALYFFALFDTSVPVDNGVRVNNFGLMNTRQTGTIIGAAILISGVVLVAIGQRKRAAIARSESGQPDEVDYYAASEEKLSKDKHTQWLRDCLKADREGKPRPPKPHSKV